MLWRQFFRAVLDHAVRHELSIATPLFPWTAQLLLGWLWKPLAAAWGVAALVSLAQGGIVFAPKLLAPDIAKLNPAKKLGQIFSITTLVQVLKALVPGAAIVFIAVDIFRREWPTLGLGLWASPRQISAHIFTIVFEVFWKSSLVLLAWAVVDYIAMRQKLESGLRMSKQEIREEMKQTDGNPATKGRIRRLQRQARRQRMLKADTPRHRRGHQPHPLRRRPGVLRPRWRRPPWSPRARTCWPSRSRKSRAGMAFPSLKIRRSRRASTAPSRSARRSPKSSTPPWPKSWPTSSECMPSRWPGGIPDGGSQAKPQPGLKTANFDWIVPAAAVSVVFVMLVPMPSFLLDLLLAMSITASVIVLLSAVYILRPVQFSVFPSLLLLLTLFRLALNLASSRRILLHGNEGIAAAGSVIAAFGQFVVGGNYVVGFVLFIALIAIQFLVVSHGAVRTAEVTARFTLDAMPGKQMAIDADLNAGLIDEHQARARREAVAREAEFYGAMDGAARFSQRDSLATILLTAINIVAGFLIGVFQLDIPFRDALKTYTILTVGDGLVTMIPSLLVSIAGGLVVTRASSNKSLGGDLGQQLFAQPRILWIAGGAMFAMGLIPGMPKFSFFFMVAVLWTMAWRLQKMPPPAEAKPPGQGRRQQARNHPVRLARRPAHARRSLARSRLRAGRPGRCQSGRKAAAPRPRLAQTSRRPARLHHSQRPHHGQPAPQAARIRHLSARG